MTSLLMSSPPIRISHRVFRCIYSNSRDIVASSPSFSRSAAKAPRRAYSQATKFIDIQRKCISLVAWDQSGKDAVLNLTSVWSRRKPMPPSPWQDYEPIVTKGVNPPRLFTIPSLSIRSSRPSALHYGPPSWMSVKTTYGAEGGCTYDTKMAARNGKRAILTIVRKVRDCQQSILPETQIYFLNVEWTRLPMPAFICHLN